MNWKTLKAAVSPLYEEEKKLKEALLNGGEDALDMVLEGYARLNHAAETLTATSAPPSGSQQEAPKKRGRKPRSQGEPVLVVPASVVAAPAAPPPIPAAPVVVPTSNEVEEPCCLRPECEHYAKVHDGTGKCKIPHCPCGGLLRAASAASRPF